MFCSHILLQNKQSNTHTNSNTTFERNGTEKKDSGKISNKCDFFLYSITLLAFLCGVLNELIITIFRKKQIGQLDTDLIHITVHDAILVTLTNVGN